MTTSSIADSDLDTAFLAGGGELGDLMRSHDWSRTPLGDPRHWPRSLKTVVRIMLTSSQPIWIGWGRELIYLYNDPYKSIIGGRHPWALGQPTASVWHEVWADIGPLLASAMSGDGTFVENRLLIMERNGYPEETYYTFSYCPVPGDDGRTAGILCANSDETRRVIGERQMSLLRDVAACAVDVHAIHLALQRCVEEMTARPRDITFALICFRRHDTSELTLAAHAGAFQQDRTELAEIASTVFRAAIDDVLSAQRPALVRLPAGLAWPGGSWKVPSQSAMVLPLTLHGDAGFEGALVVGLNPYRLADGDYESFLALVARQVSSALTNAMAYEAQRRRAEELSELDRAKTQFFSNVSHEFRTPLTLMLGPLADVLDSAPPALRGELAMVQRNAQRMSKLVNSLLEFSRIEAGRHQAIFRPADLASLTEDLASTFRAAMEKAGLRFVVRTHALPEPVYVDKEQWERIVLNLLSNALKFTLSGTVEVALHADGRQAVLEVRDTGVGVPDHEVGRLFERFHRVQGTNARTHEGSGIGLAMVQELVRIHGGTVAAQSVLGAGTTFTVRLPFGRSHLPTEAIAAAQRNQPHTGQAEVFVQEALRWLPGDDGHGIDEAVREGADGAALVGPRYRATLGARIVVADDNADLRQYLVALLRSQYRVEAVADGEQALQAVRRQRPALVLSDVMMPRLDGFGLVAALRQDSHLRTVPVILLSARAGEEARVEGLQSGADDYLVKPFTARELLVRVAAVIELDRVRRAGEEHLKLFLASAQLFTWDIDLATSKLALSDNASDVLGARPRTLEEGFAIVHRDDEARIRRVIRETAEAGEQFTDEIRIVRPDSGETRWLEVRGRAIRDGDGNAVRVSGLSFDVTQRKAMEEMLRHADRRKDEFLAMLAHELRNPMAPIRNAVELLSRLPPGDERRKRAETIINRQVEQLGRMVDDLLDVSRITQGHVELEHKLVDLTKVAAAAVEAVEPAIRGRGHDLSVTSGLPLVVAGDAARLQQCIVNLLTNAAKYTDANGSITLELLQQGEQALIRVSDNGVGIPAQLLPAVFDVFVQNPRTLDRAQGGLGIGLSVVKRLVEMHGGSVVAHSLGEGHGASFEIRLPLVKQAQQSDEPAADPASPSRRVLVVDDNEDAAESLALVLQSDGHDARAVFGPQEAIAAAASWIPDAIFLDIGLPGMDGYEVARQLRANPATARISLVALTGYGQPADLHRAQQAGFNHHMIKPASVADVSRTLRSLSASPGRSL